MSHSDDEDLRRAIALSLQESPGTSSKATVIDLTSDDEDDDLDAPVHTQPSKPSDELFLKKDDCARMNPFQNPLANPAAKEGEDPKKSNPPSSMKPQLEPNSNSGSSRASTAASMLGLNRAKMEADRLARVQQQKQKNGEEPLSGSNESKKRKASESLSGSHDNRLAKAIYSTPSQLAQEATRTPTLPSALLSGNETGNAPATQRFLSPTDLESSSGTDAQSSKALSEGGRTKSIPSTQGSRSLEIREPPLGQIQRTAPGVLSFKQQQALRASGIQYPDGIVKRTWLRGYPEEEDTIKIEEVFQKDDLELAVLSTFQVDADWVSTKFLDKTKIIWILSARDNAEKQDLQRDAPNNYRFCFPSLEGNVNMMHSKLQLLSHPTHLRVVVPSANLVPYDWGESGVMENVCFLIDLPRLAEDKVTDAGEASEFGKELVRFVRAMGLDHKVVNSLNRFDFSRTSHLRFVHTIGGSHSGEHWKLTGYCGLGRAVRSLGLDTEDALSVDIVVCTPSFHFSIGDSGMLMVSYTSSIGDIKESVIKAFYLAAQGDDGGIEYEWRANKNPKGKAGTHTERKLSDILKDRFRIYFPSKETVAESRGGLGAGGTICFQSKWYDSNTFPRHLMRDGKSRRGVLMHNKMIFVQPANPHKPGKAWAYVGSANLSESAWGRLVKDRTTKEPKLNCRNWECGVIFPVPEDAHQGSGAQVGPSTGNGMDSQNDSPCFEVFRGYVPVPMIVSGERYGTKRPWFYKE